MNLLPVELLQAVAPGAHGILLMDKAGWHTAGELRVPENLSRVFLPLYSPELSTPHQQSATPDCVPHYGLRAVSIRSSPARID